MGIRWDEPAHCLNERCFQDPLVGRVEIAMRWIGGFQTYHASCCDALLLFRPGVRICLVHCSLMNTEQ